MGNTSGDRDETIHRLKRRGWQVISQSEGKAILSKAGDTVTAQDIESLRPQSDPGGWDEIVWNAKHRTLSLIKHGEESQNG